MIIPENTYVLHGELTLDTLEEMLCTLRKTGSVYISVLPSTVVPSLANLALSAIGRIMK